MGIRTDPRPERAGAAYSALLGAICAVLAVLVVLLTLQNRELKQLLAAEAADEQQASARPERERLAVGDFFDPFGVKRADGSLERIAFEGDSPRTLLLVFAEQCPACPVVMPAWTELAASASASTRVVGIQLDPPSDFLPAKDAGYAFPVFALDDPAEVPLAKLTTVPLTALIDGAGMVIWARYANLTEADRSELLELLAG